MKFETAKRLSELLLSQSSKQNALLDEIRCSCNLEDFEEARKIVGKILGSIYIDGLYPIFNEHPSIRPDGLDP